MCRRVLVIAICSLPNSIAQPSKECIAETLSELEFLHVNIYIRLLRVHAPVAK